ncbi:hypothetical protein AOG55_09010 [Acidiplasma cupricumulans]|uniref:HTH bat-type domain-containing protein n=3 Tax=Acidiplasma TaxID=507753 RepID=A0A0N8VKV8_9ARCH|nr:hypothetical protein AOG55_09010 [Acidiplasma cupricumulans]
MNDTSFFSLKIRHENCWTNYVPENYRDVLLGYTYNENSLRAIRFSKFYNKSDIREIKISIKKDKSVKNVNIYNIDSSSSILYMDVSYENAFIDKLIKKAIYPLKSSVYNNTENYIFMTEKYRINDILKIAGNDVYIKNIRELKAEEVVPEISSYILDIFLTDKEKFVLKEAIDSKFFNIPRGASNKELAQRLNISKMAINVEIRRAVNKIVNKIKENG